MFAGKLFARAGRARFEEKGRKIRAAETAGEGVAENVQCGWKAGAGVGKVGFVMTEGAKDDGIGRKGDLLQHFERTIDPGVEIGLDAAFEFQQALGKNVFSGRQRQVVAEVIMPEGRVVICDGCLLQPHDLFH